MVKYYTGKATLSSSCCIFVLSVPKPLVISQGVSGHWSKIFCLALASSCDSKVCTALILGLASDCFTGELKFMGFDTQYGFGLHRTKEKRLNLRWKQISKKEFGMLQIAWWSWTTWAEQQQRGQVHPEPCKGHWDALTLEMVLGSSIGHHVQFSCQF